MTKLTVSKKTHGIQSVGRLSFTMPRYLEDQVDEAAERFTGGNRSRLIALALCHFLSEGDNFDPSLYLA